MILPGKTQRKITANPTAQTVLPLEMFCCKVSSHFAFDRNLVWMADDGRDPGTKLGIWLKHWGPELMELDWLQKP